MSEPMVLCENLVKIYKVADLEVFALQGLDLEVAPGEMLAIVGASGSGKTTLMNMLSAQDVPSAGRCVVDGNDLTRMTEALRLKYRRGVIGQIWQQSGRNLLPELSAEENVKLPQVLNGVSPARAGTRARELLAIVGLSDLRGHKPGQLSGGEQQRVAIGVALANEPKVLLADEPTGELDSATTDEILTLLRAVNRDLGLTIIIVTHDVNVAAAVDRTIAIRDGRTSTETVRRVGADLARPTAGEAITAPNGEASVGASSLSGREVISAPSRGGGSAPPNSTIIGLSSETHREFVLIDRVGRLQLPRDIFESFTFNGRAEVRKVGDHVEIWPAE